MTAAMTRKPDWPSRLDAFIDGVRRRKLQYGSFDCALGFTADAVLAMTGVDPAAAWRGRYASEAGAIKQMRAGGFVTLADMAGGVLPEIHVARARTGDIAAIPRRGPFGHSLGVVVGDRIFVIGENMSGLGTVDLMTAARAFQV